MDEQVLQRIREAFAVERERTTLLEKKVKDLERLVSGHGTLLVELRGTEAYDIHTGFPVQPFDILKDRGIDK